MDWEVDFSTSTETKIRFCEKNIMNMKHWNEVLASKTSDCSLLLQDAQQRHWTAAKAELMRRRLLTQQRREPPKSPNPVSKSFSHFLNIDLTAAVDRSLYMNQYPVY